MSYNQYISMDPDILRGKPCIAGTRISVELILELLSLDLFAFNWKTALFPKNHSTDCKVVSEPKVV